MLLPGPEQSYEVFVGGDLAVDILLHIELHVLAHLLDPPDELPGVTLGLDLGCDVEIDEDGSLEELHGLDVLLHVGDLILSEVDDLLDVTLGCQDLVEGLHGLVDIRIVSADEDLEQRPPELGFHLGPLGCDDVHDVLDQGHAVLHILIDEVVVAYGPVLHVDGQFLTAHVLVDLLCDVGCYGGEHQCGVHDRIVQGEVGCVLVGDHVVVLGPGPVPDEADVPSGEVLHDVVLQHPGELVQLPGLQELGCGPLHLLRPGDHPAVLVAEVCGDVLEGDLLGIESVDDHVGGCEVDHVPVGVEDLPGVLGSVLLECGVLPGCVALDQIVSE